METAVRKHNAPNADDLYVWLLLVDKISFEDAAFKMLYEAHRKHDPSDDAWTFTVQCDYCCCCG